MKIVVAFAVVVLLVQLLGPTSAAFFRHHREVRMPDRFSSSVLRRVRVKRDLQSSLKQNRPANPFAEFLKRRERSLGGLFDFFETMMEQGEHMLEAGQEMLEEGQFEEVKNKTFVEDIGNGEKATVHEEVLEDEETGFHIVIDSISATGDGDLDSFEEEFDYPNFPDYSYDETMCMGDEDCDEGKVCFGSVFDGMCAEPFGEGEPCFQDEMCSRDALCIMGHCQTGAVAGQEGSVCDVAADCQDGLCCGYLVGDEFSDVVTPVCKPLLQEGEPCRLGGLLSMLMPIGFGGPGDHCSCKTGLHCGRDESGSHVCKVDEDEASDSMEPEADMPEPPVEDAGIEFEPEQIEFEPEQIEFEPEQVPAAREIRSAEKYKMEDDITGVLEKFREWVKAVVGMADQAEGYEDDYECPETEDYPEKTDDSPEETDDLPEKTDDNPNTPDATEAEPEDDGFDEFLSEIKELVNEEVFPSGQSDQTDDIDEDFPDDTLKFKPFRED